MGNGLAETLVYVSVLCSTNFRLIIANNIRVIFTVRSKSPHTSYYEQRGYHLLHGST